MTREAPYTTTVVVEINTAVCVYTTLHLACYMLDYLLIKCKILAEMPAVAFE